MNRDRYPSCHALRDECRLRTEARAIGKQGSPATLDLQHFHKNTHGFRRVRATMVFWYPQIWTQAQLRQPAHTHTLFQLLHRHTDGNIRRARTRSLKRSTRHKNQNAQNAKTMSSCLKLCELATRGRKDTQYSTSAQVQLEKHRTVPCIHVLLNDTREDSTVNAKCAERCKNQMHLAFHDMCNSEECASD